MVEALQSNVWAGMELCTGSRPSSRSAGGGGVSLGSGVGGGVGVGGGGVGGVGIGNVGVDGGGGAGGGIGEGGGGIGSGSASSSDGGGGGGKMETDGEAVPFSGEMDNAGEEVVSLLIPWLFRCCDYQWLFPISVRCSSLFFCCFLFCIFFFVSLLLCLVFFFQRSGAVYDSILLEQEVDAKEGGEEYKGVSHRL